MAGLDSNGVNSSDVCGFEGGGTNDRHIETKVLLRFGYFNNGCLASTKLAAPQNGSIGALKTFNGEYGAFFDNNGLSDVQSAHLFGDTESVGKIVDKSAIRGGTSEVPLWR